MTVYQLLTKLGEAEIKLWVEQGELRFRAPKGALTPDLREQVVAQKSELIQFLQQSRSGEALKQRNIQAVSRSVPIPLSFGQERLWFLSQLEPESSAYHIPILLELSGALDPHKLDAALGEVTKRHEILRTLMVAKDNASTAEGHQQVLPQAHWPLHYEDISAYNETDKESQRRKLIETTRSSVFVLNEGPLLRAVLIKLEEQRYQLILTLHHIISDGWSMGVLVKELMSLYLAQGSASLDLSQVLPPLAIQYGDYAHWQREWLAGSEKEQQLGYWCHQLKDLPVLELPLDKPRPAALHPRGDAHFFHWPKDLHDQARSYSQKQGATLFMTLLAAFEVLLNSYSGQDDFAVGTPIANRTMPEQEALIGFFVNTLALRAQVDQQQSFESLLQAVQRTTLEAYAHQDLPFEQVVEGLNVSRELAYTPLFQVMFSLQNESDIQLALPGLQISTLPLSRRSSKCDLNLTFTETPAGLRGELEYSTELFKPETISRMESQLQHLLENLLAAPQVPLCQVSMLSARQKQQILTQWNPPASQLGEVDANNYGLAALFEQQVTERPQAIALQWEQTQLSYTALNQQANHYAQNLLNSGLKPGHVVALCGPRSPERIVALLAIVKVGAVYLPLETDQAAGRQMTLLSQGQAAWLIVEEQQNAAFSDLSSIDSPPVLLPYPQIKEGLEGIKNPGLPASPEQRAYIMFTSGSTGEPKGIVIPQRGIVRLVKENGFLELGPDTCLLHYAPLAFDASTFEIWGALLNGGKLVLPPSGLLELEQLGDIIHQSGVNTLWLTAALFHAMAEHHPQGFAPLKNLLAGGDQLNPHAVKRVMYRYPRLTFINGYGPTENTTFTSCHVMHSPDQVGRSVSIGKAINGTQIYVLNQALEPQAVGVPGELCTAGEGVALGYLKAEENHQASQSAAFIDNPFAYLPGHGPTLYRTGDLVRYLADGSLEFLGRIDQQVKIRGFRIELGEVEAALSSLPWVSNCVVAVQEKNKQKYLVAYLEGTQSQKDSVSEKEENSQQEALIQRTRSQLSRLLPDYMQPAAYVLLDTLPVTRNGKVDRKALPAATIGGQATADGTPSTELEAELFSIWQAVLNIDELGIHDNFFELGGHSLLATQVTSRVRKKLGYELPVREMFASPTIAQCAAWLVEHGQHHGVSAQTVMVKRAGGEATPATYAQRRLWLLEQLNPGSSAYLIPAALRIRGPLDMPCVNKVVNALIARHETLRTAIVKDEANEEVILHQQVFDHLTVDLQRETYLGEVNPQAIQQLIDDEAGKSFDLSQAPLIRMRFLALDKANNQNEASSAEQDTLLLLTMHHIISDGWSMSVFIKEFTELYEAFRHHRENPLPELAFQYGDYACWQQQWLDEAHLQTALNFWVEQVSDKDPVLQLPTDFPRPNTPSSPGALIHHTLPVSLTQDLLALSEREGVSLFMLSLSVWQLLLSRYSGQAKFNLGSPVAGRTMAETEAMIGFFINTVVFGADVAEDQSFREFLYQVREQSLAGFAHQNLPFEMLVDAIQPERSLSHSPLFQVFLNVLNLPSASREVADLRIEDLSDEQQNYAAKFDLTLYVQPQDEGLKLSMLYRSDCFSPQSIERHLAHLESLFSQLVVDLDRPLAAFQLLQKNEKSLLPDPLQALPLKEFVLPQQQISTQAQKRIKEIALVDMDGNWTYGELEQRSNQLAHALQQAGLLAEAPVVIYGHRSGALVCALLAIIKAGGAFVVLDPTHPEQRLLLAMKDVQPQAALHLEPAGLLPENLAAAFSFLPIHLSVPGLRGWQQKNSFSSYSKEMPPEQSKHLDQLSYLMLTSGTSGKSKVIRGSLRPITALLDWYPRSFDVSEKDHFSLFSGLGHDPLLRDIFLPLSLGAKIVIPDPELMKNPDQLRQWMMEQALSVCHLTPALAQLITQDAEKSPPCESLRYLLFSGDKLHGHTLEPIKQLAPQAALINCYGCTETPQIHSWHQVNDKDKGLIPVGQGSEYSQLLLLDKRQRLAGIGEMAEIYVRSPYLALGYKDEDKAVNRSAFINNPLDAENGKKSTKAMLYRSGDYGRYRADGSVEVLGRHDFQVKIRGYRIELEDVSACIKSITSIQQVVVCLETNENAFEKTQLVAYLCTPELNSETLRAQLREHLPDYMLPNAFIAVEKIPLNPNGKLDQAALKRLASEQSCPFKAPERESEITLAAIWADVLQRPRVGVNENFFELGGQSLLATQLLARVNNHFKIELPLKMVFELTSIESMADYIDTALWAREQANQTPTEEGDDWEELEL